MSIVDLDHIHQKVTTKKLTKDELLEIATIIDRATSFKHSEISVNDIFNEIATYEKIQDTNLKSRESLEEIAKIPYPSKKALEAIQDRLFYPDRKENDVIFVNFLKHSKLPWIEIAKIAELTKHLKAKFGDGSNTASEERITAIFNFCKRSDTPAEVRNFLYQHTQDNDFLTQVAKDVFLF